MYLVMARTEFDDVPLGLFHTLADAQRGAVMATQYTAECADVAEKVMGVKIAYDGDPDRVVIVEFKNGVPTQLVGHGTAKTENSLAAFTAVTWAEALDEDDDGWN